MKKRKAYEVPQFEISLLSVEDILATSFDVDFEDGDDNDDIWSDWL